MATSGGVVALAVATLLFRAACLWSTWAYRDLSQSILVHPLSGWPFTHTQHKRLLPEPSRIPHHQYALSAPRLPEDQFPIWAGAAQMVLQPSSNMEGPARMSLSWLRLHLGDPIRRVGVPLCGISGGQSGRPCELAGRTATTPLRGYRRGGPLKVGSNLRTAAPGTRVLLQVSIHPIPATNPRSTHSAPRSPMPYRRSQLVS